MPSQRSRQRARARARHAASLLQANRGANQGSSRSRDSSHPRPPRRKNASTRLHSRSPSRSYRASPPASPTYLPTSPAYSPTFPRHNSPSPPYSASPPYNPTSPPYSPTSPYYSPGRPTSPPYSPNSPYYSPNSLGRPTSPLYSHYSPHFRPVSPPRATTAASNMLTSCRYPHLPPEFSPPCPCCSPTFRARTPSPPRSRLSPPCVAPSPSRAPSTEHKNEHPEKSRQVEVQREAASASIMSLKKVKEKSSPPFTSWIGKPICYKRESTWEYALVIDTVSDNSQSTTTDSSNTTILLAIMPTLPVRYLTIPFKSGAVIRVSEVNYATNTFGGQPNTISKRALTSGHKAVDDRSRTTSYIKDILAPLPSLSDKRIFHRKAKKLVLALDPERNARVVYVQHVINCRFESNGRPPCSTALGNTSSGQKRRRDQQDEVMQWYDDPLMRCRSPYKLESTKNLMSQQSNGLEKTKATDANSRDGPRNEAAREKAGVVGKLGEEGAAAAERSERVDSRAAKRQKKSSPQDLANLSDVAKKGKSKSTDIVPVQSQSALSSSERELLEDLKTRVAALESFFVDFVFASLPSQDRDKFLACVPPSMSNILVHAASQMPAPLLPPTTFSEGGRMGETMENGSRAPAPATADLMPGVPTGLVPVLSSSSESTAISANPCLQVEKQPQTSKAEKDDVSGEGMEKALAPTLPLSSEEQDQTKASEHSKLLTSDKYSRTNQVRNAPRRDKRKRDGVQVWTRQDSSLQMSANHTDGPSDEMFVILLQNKYIGKFPSSKELAQHLLDKHSFLFPEDRQEHKEADAKHSAQNSSSRAQKGEDQESKNPMPMNSGLESNTANDEEEEEEDLDEDIPRDCPHILPSLCVIENALSFDFGRPSGLSFMHFFGNFEAGQQQPDSQKSDNVVVPPAAGAEETESLYSSKISNAKDSLLPGTRVPTSLFDIRAALMAFQDFSREVYQKETQSVVNAAVDFFSRELFLKEHIAEIDHCEFDEAAGGYQKYIFDSQCLREMVEWFDRQFGEWRAAVARDAATLRSAVSQMAAELATGGGNISCSAKWPSMYRSVEAACSKFSTSESTFSDFWVCARYRAVAVAYRRNTSSEAISRAAQSPSGRYVSPDYTVVPGASKKHDAMHQNALPSASYSRQTDPSMSLKPENTDSSRWDFCLPHSERGKDQHDKIQPRNQSHGKPQSDTLSDYIRSYNASRKREEEANCDSAIGTYHQNDGSTREHEMDHRAPSELQRESMDMECSSLSENEEEEEETVHEFHLEISDLSGYASPSDIQWIGGPSPSADSNGHSEFGDVLLHKSPFDYDVSDEHISQPLSLHSSEELHENESKDGSVDVEMSETDLSDDDDEAHAETLNTSRNSSEHWPSQRNLQPFSKTELVMRPPNTSSRKTEVNPAKPDAQREKAPEVIEQVVAPIKSEEEKVYNPDPACNITEGFLDRSVISSLMEANAHRSPPPARVNFDTVPNGSQEESKTQKPADESSKSAKNLLDTNVSVPEASSVLAASKALNESSDVSKKDGESSIPSQAQIAMKSVSRAADLVVSESQESTSGEKSREKQQANGQVAAHVSKTLETLDVAGMQNCPPKGETDAGHNSILALAQPKQLAERGSTIHEHARSASQPTAEAHQKGETTKDERRPPPASNNMSLGTVRSPNGDDSKVVQSRFDKCEAGSKEPSASTSNHETTMSRSRLGPAVLPDESTSRLGVGGGIAGNDIALTGGSMSDAKTESSVEASVQQTTRPALQAPERVDTSAPHALQPGSPIDTAAVASTTLSNEHDVASKEQNEQKLSSPLQTSPRQLVSLQAIKDSTAKTPITQGAISGSSSEWEKAKHSMFRELGTKRSADWNKDNDKKPSPKLNDKKPSPKLNDKRSEHHESNVSTPRRPGTGSLEEREHGRTGREDRERGSPGSRRWDDSRRRHEDGAFYSGGRGYAPSARHSPQDDDDRPHWSRYHEDRDRGHFGARSPGRGRFSPGRFAGHRYSSPYRGRGRGRGRDFDHEERFGRGISRGRHYFH